LAHFYKLIGPDGKLFISRRKGTLAGYKPLKIYGRLDCPSGLRFMKPENRVFFLTEAHAIAAGYRPCAKCLPEKYKHWKSQY